MGLAPALLLAPLFTLGLAPVDLGDTPPAMRSARACLECHEAAHGEWQRSRHAASWTNAIFQREYQLAPNAWCRNCHAPTGLPEIADEGINCAVCHVRDGQILAARRRPGSPHETRVTAGFGSPDYCAGCHQFNFPAFGAPDDSRRVTGYTPHPMQNTVAEHAAGAKRSTPCRDCHADTPGRHLYAGGHDPAMLRRAVELTLCREGSQLVATVTNRGAGHRVPTGDVHRHLVLRAWRPSAPEALAELVLSRRFEPQPDGGKALVADSSLGPGESRALRVGLGKAGGRTAEEPLSVELRFVYTVDEFPLREVGEPVWTTVQSERVSPSALAPCVR